MNKVIPDVIYKYRGWNTPEEVMFITERKAFFSRSIIHDKSEYLLGSSGTFFTDMKKYGSDYFASILREGTANVWYIFSASLSWQSDFLWTHFADCYKGYCLGFNILALLESFETTCAKFLPLIVRYYNTEEGVPHYCIDDWESWDEGAVLTFLHSLPDIFSEEKEVRIISTYKGELSFTPDCVREIMIGEYADERTKEEIFNLRESTYPNASVFRVKYCDMLELPIREPFV